ncbi:glutamate 5-kinase [uncultured Rikenella sp.]|uniref:glutamate 5-kinase n=1 Tax=uncultured Rikenella sp. TaxID=368003 RepID=UPI00260C4320|nr:glutamate 5-kinase [uncultured Rikenella sp.]
METYKRVAVKVGSNVLTRSDGTLDVTRMSALVDQMVTLRRAGIEVILISSGAVASGRSELGTGLKLDDVSSRQLYSAVGQAKLINRYYDLFRGYGIACGQVLTTKDNFGSRNLYLNQKNCIGTMLAAGVVPIVNENDAVSITELMFTDNDELSGLIATMMDVEALVILSHIDGIYDGDPSCPGTQVIRHVEPSSPLERYIQSGKSQFGRGGMLTKSTIARKVASEGVEVIIANGKRDDILPALLLGTAAEREDVVCTRFVPSGKAPSSVKRWIAHSESFAKGKLHLNEGAVKALSGPEATSLLPVGIVSVEGTFDEGNIVRLVGPDGVQIGVGLVTADSEAVSAAAGKHGGRPVVHYDYMYLDL